MALYWMEFKYLHVAEIRTERLFGSDQDGQEQDGVHQRDSWSSFSVLEVKPERPDWDGLSGCIGRRIAEVGTGRQEVWRKSREELHGCSERRHEMSWCGRRWCKGKGQMEACDWLLPHCWELVKGEEDLFQAHVHYEVHSPPKQIWDLSFFTMYHVLPCVEMKCYKSSEHIL